MEIKITINDKLINVLKRVFTLKNSIFIAAAILFCGGLFIFSQQVELDTFHDGDVIYAGPINDNFRALKDRELGSLGDVDVSGVQNDYVLKWDGTNWTPAADETTPNGIGGHWTKEGNDVYYNDGNVGIGTAAPSYRLELKSSGLGDIVLGIEESGDTEGVFDVFESLSGSGVLRVFNTDNSVGVLLRGDAGNSYILNSNVGIGTTEPGGLLDVNGKLLVDNNGYTQINDDDGTDSRLYLGNTISGTGPNNGLLIEYAGINAYIANYENGGDFIFQTATGPAVRIEDDGNVGIGTMDPQAALDMGSGGIRLGGVTRTTWPTGGSGVWTESGDDIYWNGAGNVGIGTTAPEELLDIAGGHILLDNNYYLVAPTSGGGGPYALIGYNNSNQIQIGDPVINQQILIAENDTQILLHANSYINFQTNDTDVLRIDNSGNVGIGTIAPAAELQVSSTAPGLRIQDTDSTSSISTKLEFVGSDNSTVRGWIGKDGSNVMKVYNTAAANLELGANSLTALTIQSGGNVGIGTTEPENKLHVDGAINLDPIAEPATPTTGFVLYVDTADGDLKAKSHNGTITTIAAD